VLPETCESVVERDLQERSAAWILKQVYVCPGGLLGETLGIEYPMVNASVSTLFRVDLLDGERYARVLDPGQSSFQLPEPPGHAPPALRRAQEAVLEGIAHFAGNGVHLLFLLSVVLVGPPARSIRLASFFTIGQLAAGVLGWWAGLSIPMAYGEIALAVAAALLCREALRPDHERRQLGILAAAGGAVHGLALAGSATAPLPGLFLVLEILGLDASLLLSILVLALLARLVPAALSRAPFPAAVLYLVAGASLGLAVARPVPGLSDADARPRRELQLPDVGGTSGAAASRRVAPRMPDVPLQSFVSVGAFEVRHEVLVKLQDLAGPLDLEPSGTVPVAAQDALRERLGRLVAARTAMTIDGRQPEPVDRQVDFMSWSPQGALLRPAPVAEPVADAWVGVTTVYLSEATPRALALQWTRFDLAPVVPATVTDPESSRTVRLDPAQTVLRWENELAEDPAPVVRSTVVEPARVWVPLLALLPLGALLFLATTGLRGRRYRGDLAAARILLAAVLLLTPTGGVVWALPWSAAPDPVQARRILSGVLPNLYRAFEFPGESAVYDRLALSVTGDTLTEVYLEHRRAMEMEARGGARARVEAVEVTKVDSVEPGAENGFVASAGWTVGGTVSHFGHRHFRQNRYRARVDLVPVDGFWKVRSVELLDEERLR
jgi:hypothetical protein